MQEIAQQRKQRISIHALLAESDRGQRPNWGGCQTFLSTLSLRRATPSLYQLYDTYAISIHALLAESDPPYNLMIHHAKNFYPRSPCGERHAPNRHPCPRSKISIHALLAESDT